MEDITELINRELKKKTLDYIQNDLDSGRMAKMIDGKMGLLGVNSNAQEIREDLFNFLRKYKSTNLFSKEIPGIIFVFIEWIHLELYFIKHFEHKNKKNNEKRKILLTVGLIGTVHHINKDLRVPNECLNRIFDFYGFVYGNDEKEFTKIEKDMLKLGKTRKKQKNKKSIKRKV